MNEIELKPCPFCGGNAGLVNSFDSRGNYSVVICLECNITGQKSRITEKRYADKEAISSWNRRVELKEEN